jgi:hypothetical protein
VERDHLHEAEEGRAMINSPRRDNPRRFEPVARTCNEPGKQLLRVCKHLNQVIRLDSSIEHLAQRLTLQLDSMDISPGVSTES